MDIRESAWQYWAPIMWARLDVAKKIGCDGVEGDQINSYGNDKTFNITQAHSLRLYREYYYQAHQRGLTVISKNGVELTDQQAVLPSDLKRRIFKPQHRPFKKPPQGGFIKWWAMRDLNLRPRHYQ